jgi:chemotaxis protein MotB
MEHKMNRLLINFLAISTALILFTGCVSKGTYDDAVSENKFLESQNQALLEELDMRDDEITAMEEEQLEMSSVLNELLIAGSVKMQLLADGLHIELSHDILFKTGSAELSEEGSALIALLGQEMTDYSYQVVVMGYTDSVPVGGQLAEKYPSNWELAGARAASVVRIMAVNGISPEQLGAVSFGSTRPLASNDTPEGRAANRRIEIRLRPVQISASNP